MFRMIGLKDICEDMLPLFEVSLEFMSAFNNVVVANKRSYCHHVYASRCSVHTTVSNEDTFL